MTSFDDLLKFSNRMSLKRPEDVDPMASAIWEALIEDYYAGLEKRYGAKYADQVKRREPPGITMRMLNLPTS